MDLSSWYETTLRFASYSWTIFLFCLFCALPLLLVRHLAHRIHSRLKERYEPPEEHPQPGSEKAQAERRETPPPGVSPPGWDERDYEESWDRERRRRYGRHQHKHGHHHRTPARVSA